MKRNFIDNVIGFFNPEAGARRLQSRIKQDLLVRGYDAAKDMRTSDWSSATKTSANAEVKGAQAKLRDRSRDIVRNNPYGVRGVNVIVSNTVGAGIVAKLQGTSPAQTDEVRAAWKAWAETTACDAAGRLDFYGLQSLIFRSAVESGDSIGKRIYAPVTTIVKGKPQTKIVPRIQVLEGDFLDATTNKDDGSIVQGVTFDKNGARTAYALFSRHPGDAKTVPVTVPATEVAHVYRQDRPGQVRGVPWAHAIIEPLKSFDDYQQATLIGRKVAACFTAFITTNDSDSALSAADRQAKREQDNAMTPANIRYLGQGESMQLASPPPVSGYSEFIRESLRAIASGWGISYEAFSNDYSQSNYSSSRLGHLEFRRNIDQWRWNLLVPQFCNPAFEWFKEYAQITGVNMDGVTVEWVPPAYEMIDPVKDANAIRNLIRIGVKTLPQAIREQGLDPDTQLEEIAATNKILDSLEIALDSDPRKMSTIGFAQAGDSLDKLSDVKQLPTSEGTTTDVNKDESAQADDAGSAG